MEKSRETISRLCQLAAILFLAGGFGMAKGWLGVILMFAILPFGWTARRYQRKWFASMMLVTYVGIVVYGLLSGISAYLVVAGVSAALAWWELEDRIPISQESSTPSIADKYEKAHLTRLGLAISIGLIVAEAGLFLKFRLPFGVVFVVTLLVLFSFYQLYRLLRE